MSDYLLKRHRFEIVGDGCVAQNGLLGVEYDIYQQRKLGSPTWFIGFLYDAVSWIRWEESEHTRRNHN